mmetsp:Transcript_40983/g.96224  ORF Transcript_40983/g.96224 Transcript_40983/m.96224 type:complete len:84 (-) Transcript_40983:532-783(-)
MHIDRIDDDRIVGSTRTRENLLTFRNPAPYSQKLENAIYGSKERADGKNSIGCLSPRFHDTHDDDDDGCEKNGSRRRRRNDGT